MSVLSKERNGRATSSQIYRIAKNYKGGKFLKPAITYIEEIKMERKLKRSLDGGADSQAIRWGNYMEHRLFQKLGLEWSMSSKDTIIHKDPKFAPYWSGTPDLMSKTKCGEIKCFQLKHFCQIVDVFNAFKNGDLTEEETVDILRSQEPEIYWQTLSNAMLMGVSIGEMIIYAPSESEMDEIREDLGDPELLDEPWKYRFIVEQTNDELAVIPDESEYQSINTFEFKIPTADKIHLTKAMIEAIKIIEA
jgi:hypothetical protein